MSLVSDALKKAQRSRSPDLPGGSHAVGRRGPLLTTQHIIWILVGFAAIIAIGVTITVVVVRNSAAELAAAKTPQAPRAANGSAPAVQPPTNIPAAAPASATPAIPIPAAPATRVAETALSTPPASGKIPPMAPVAAAMKPELRIQIFVDDAKITAKAIRADAPAENKVQLNDRVFRVNDIVDRTLNLRITEIFEDHLTFVDENGAKYTKRF